MVLTSCRQVEPQRRSTEAEIRQHIAGEWTLSKKPEVSWYPKMTLAEDGIISVINTDGTRVLLGTWEYQDRMLKIKPGTELVEAARATGSPLNAWDYCPVVYADAHELVMAPGISVAGRLRFMR